MATTPHRRAEAELTAFALSLPETDLAPGWGKDEDQTRYLRVRKKGFAVFGDKGETDDALTLTVKLPTSYEMVQHLPFVVEGSDWYRKNRWIKAYFRPEDDVMAELETLKAWIVQSYAAMAPKKLGREVLEMHRRTDD